MGVKKTAAEHGDRVRWDNGKGEWYGTIIDLHANKTKGEPGPNFGVLADDSDGHVRNWPKSECTVLDDRPKACPRCGVEGHRAQQCQTKYFEFRDRKRAERAQQPTPQPVAIPLATGWDVDF